MKTIKPALALCLALAIPFALGACSGGGELTIPEIPEIPVKVAVEGVEQPEQPAQPEQPGGTGQPEQPGETPQPALKFFPLKDGHLPRMTLRFDSQFAIPELRDQRLSYPLGSKTTLDTLIPSTVISPWGTGEELAPTNVNIPQFSAFDFGDSEARNGIPVQEATAEQTGRYAAYAYQAILEHSAHIFQAGMRHNEDLKDGHLGRVYKEFKYLPYVATLSTGEKASLPEGSSGIKGTWKGKAFGIEGTSSTSNPGPIIGGSHSPPTLASTRNRLVTANVEITAEIGKDEPRGIAPNSELDMRFYNWKGGTDNYKDLIIGTKHGGRLNVLAPIDHVLVEWHSHDPTRPLPRESWMVEGDNTGARFQFYGPDGAEVAGYWWARWYKGYTVHGGFVARKPPE